MHSFIKPRKKKILDDVTTLWVGFIVLVAIGLLVFGVIVHYKSSFYIKMLDTLDQQNSKQMHIEKNLKNNIALIKMQANLDKDVKETNIVLKQSMKNLFDLIPDQITLNSVVMKKDSLLLKGYTNAIESYTLLLEPPLKSIFTKSVAKFCKDDKGHVVFESYNSMSDTKDINESDPK